MITVLDSTGFVGSHLVQKLAALGMDYQTPARGENLTGKNLETIVYCIGLTADFRERPLDTVEAHVCKLLEIIRGCQFHKLIYLSSTRVYNKSVDIAHEENILGVNSSDPSDLYNISKLMGESLIWSLGPRGCVVRLSNVYGKDLDADNFLSRIIQDALMHKKVVLETAMESEKDYISVDDVVALLAQIAEKGVERMYNIASGVNVSNGDILRYLSQITGCKVEVNRSSNIVKHPPISINRIRSEFGYTPKKLLADMENLVRLYEHPQGEERDDNN